MNIFAVDPDPETCSRYLDDKRLIKMALETTQLVSNAVLIHGGYSPYKGTHLNHPCSLWVAKNLQHFAWLADYGLHLFREYHDRFGKIHKSSNVLLWLVGEVAQSKRIPDTKEPLEFVYVGAPYKFVTGEPIKDTHALYRACLRNKWRNQAAEGRAPRWNRKEDRSRYE